VKTARDGFVHAVGEPRLLGTSRQVAAADRSAELREIATRERPLTIERLPGGGAEAEDVGSLVGRLATELLGSHVGRRAHQGSRSGQRGRDPARVRSPGLPGGIGGGGGLEAGEAEVGHPHATVGANQDIVGLEVSVDHPGGVRGGESPTRGGEDLDDRVPVALRRAQP
jgi:hypothetical protein